MPAVAKTKDAIAVLTSDHKEVDALFKEYDRLCKSDADDGEKGLLAAQICTMLIVHTTIEEEVFYPAARAALEDAALLDEAEVEHTSAKDLIAQIEGAEPGEDLYDAKVQVLGEYIRHHVKEEEGEIFPRMKKAKVDLVMLGTALLERKDEAMSNRRLADEPAS